MNEQLQAPAVEPGGEVRFLGRSWRVERIHYNPTYGYFLVLTGLEDGAYELIRASGWDGPYEVVRAKAA